MALTSREWVEQLHRLIWGVEYLSSRPWLSDAESASLLDVRVVGGKLLGEDFLRYSAPGLRRELAAVVVAVGDRGEARFLADWYASAVAVCRLVFEQRSTDLDAQAAARAAELDAVWDKTVADVSLLSDEALTAVCRGAGALVAGAGEAAGRGLGAFLGGLFQSPAVVVGGLVLAWWAFGRRGGGR